MVNKCNSEKNNLETFGVLALFSYCSYKDHKQGQRTDGIFFHHYTEIKLFFGCFQYGFHSVALKDTDKISLYTLLFFIPTEYMGLYLCNFLGSIRSFLLPCSHCFSNSNLPTILEFQVVSYVLLLHMPC